MSSLSIHIPDPVQTASMENALSSEEIINEVTASMALEGMPLSEEEKDMLRDLHAGKVTGDELRQRIIASVIKGLSDNRLIGK